MIHLDHIDGFEFERVCADIFRRAGWGQVQQLPPTGDKGRDLIIRDDAGNTTVVECKHRPNSPVGRPVVQKLHSAVISSKAGRGIIVTTGRYTDEATEHARHLSKETPIDLFTLSHLTDLADRAGMTLVANGASPRIFRLPCAGDRAAYDRIRHEVDKLHSHPGRPTEMMNLASHTIVLRPCYLMKANIAADFCTAVGLVHSVDERGVRLAIDGVTGGTADLKTSTAICGFPINDRLRVKTNADVRREDFSCSVDAARRVATSRLCRSYSRRVGYKGKNNVSYQKDCTVSPRSVHFADIKQALLPVHVMTIRLAKSVYLCKIVGGGDGIMIDAPLGTCAICKKAVRNRPTLCNSCGSVYHPRRLFGGHGSRCKNCGKTICDRCTHKISHAIFFKKSLCGDCATPRGPPPAPGDGAREGRLGGEGQVAGTSDISIGAEWAGGGEWKEERRKKDGRPRRKAASKAHDPAVIAAVIAAAVFVIGLVVAAAKRR